LKPKPLKPLKPHNQRHRIKSVTSDTGSVAITLDNGIVLHVSSNHGYINCHFSGLGDDELVVTPVINRPELGIKVSNYINLVYGKALLKGGLS
jgi:hypothetical protein